MAAEQWRPDFFYIYLPHLDYAAQRNGPESVEADTAVAELDELIGQLAERMGAAYGEDLLWLVAGEYAITPVDHVAYPNRVLRQAGLLAVRQEADGERAWTWRRAGPGRWSITSSRTSSSPAATGQLAARVAEVFRREPGIAEVLLGDERGPLRIGPSAERRGGFDFPAAELAGVLLVAFRRSRAAVGADGRYSPQARLRPGGTLLRPATKGIPLDARRIKGSHGAPAVERGQRGVILASEPICLPGVVVADTDVFGVVLRHFGLKAAG